jgi:exosome complex RNA-binding protein Csl4
MSKKSDSVTPGQRLGYTADYNQGAGTYERDGLLYASVVGQRYVDPAKDDMVISSNYTKSNYSYSIYIVYSCLQ